MALSYSQVIPPHRTDISFLFLMFYRFANVSNMVYRCFLSSGHKCQKNIKVPIAPIILNIISLFIFSPFVLVFVVLSNMRQKV
nr:MAG TPA: hypothetical protein [Microviridae sp.]